MTFATAAAALAAFKTNIGVLEPTLLIASGAMLMAGAPVLRHTLTPQAPEPVVHRVQTKLVPMHATS